MHTKSAKRTASGITFWDFRIVFVFTVLGCSEATTQAVGTGGMNLPAGGQAQAGGSSATGGAAASGGTSSLSGGSVEGGRAFGGGSTTTGGARNGGTMLGGTVAGGGAAGGSNASGGALATGGIPRTGGRIGPGGAIATGGVTASGGISATGGATLLGGIAATGGMLATGGVLATGGASGTGMRDLTSMALVKEMGIGWNLGNTLDAIGGETAWGNPVTTQAMIQAIAASGFKSIRIPVTWAGHFGAGPGFVIDKAWMDRVQQIVDWSQAAGLYAIINMHHDGLTQANGGWLQGAATDATGVIQKFKALWAQIADRFKDYSDYLVFESMNEVGFDSMNFSAAVALLNRMNGEFVTLVRASGGKNAQRHLLLAGYFTDIGRSTGVVMHDNRCILSVHYYTPYQFAINGNPTTWGSAAEIATLKADFATVKRNFLDKGIPVILGEYGVVLKTETASRIYWFEYVTKTAFDLGVAPFLWDDGGGGGQFNRRNRTWPAGVLEALKRASSGEAYTPTKG